MRCLGAGLFILCGAALGFGAAGVLRRRANCLRGLQRDLAVLLSSVEHLYLPLPEALQRVGGDWETLGLFALGEAGFSPPAGLQERDVTYLCGCLISLAQAGRGELTPLCANIRTGMAALCEQAGHEAATQGALWKSLATGAGCMLAILYL